MNPGHYGYELPKGQTSLTINHDNINLIEELLQNDASRVNDLLRLILGILSRDWSEKREDTGENGPDSSSSEQVTSSTLKKFDS